MNLVVAPHSFYSDWNAFLKICVNYGTAHQNENVFNAQSYLKEMTA